MPSKLAVQMYTVREHTRTEGGLADSFARIARMGYPAVQLSAVGAMNGPEASVSPVQARKLLDDNNLRCIATHRNWDDLANSTEREIDFHHTLGCDFTAIGGLPPAYGKQGAEGFRQFVRDAAPIIARLKAGGIRFAYHNHDWEFERIGPGRRTLFDILLDEGDSDLLLELDLYWAAHAGLNPERLVERAHARIPVLHIKDKEYAAGEGPVMAPIGEGNMDWDKLIPACEAAGVEWYAVEQDVCRRDPFACLQSSFTYLTALMGR